MNLSSLKQLELLGKIKEKSEAGIRIFISAYYNLKGGGQGMSSREIYPAIGIAEKYGLKIIGFQTYIGTNIFDEQKYIDSTIALQVLADNLAERVPNLRYINIGGGFGIPYSSQDKRFRWDIFGRRASELFERIKGNEDHRIQFKMEPGRSIVGDAGYFLTRVVELKRDNILVVDAPYTNFARPFVYHTNHRVRCVGKDGKLKQFEIRGCSINSEDYLSRPEFEGDSAYLPENIQEGDLLCFKDVGAYSPAMQMDFLDYNKAPTILVEGGEIKKAKKD
ncbi:hypothetical protein A3K73_01875 [Candidatus Pacearchaeota archaeon RBG_13_36_9]|nr:MAG: hypothetical protein A3K73_01875 [Candidatus Pacearchaeota archaeon RBG_13_36_9]